MFSIIIHPYFAIQFYQDVLTKAVDDLAALEKHDEEQAAKLVELVKMIEELEDAQKKAKKDKMVAFMMNLNLMNQVQQLQTQQQQQSGITTKSDFLVYVRNNQKLIRDV